MSFVCPWSPSGLLVLVLLSVTRDQFRCDGRGGEDPEGCGDPRTEVMTVVLRVWTQGVVCFRIHVERVTYSDPVHEFGVGVF